MNRIFKYDFGPLNPGSQTIMISNVLSTILDFQEQYGHLVMWASASSEVDPHPMTIDVRWTGETEPNKTYFKTIQGSDGLVYHIYI